MSIKSATLLIGILTLVTEQAWAICGDGVLEAQEACDESENASCTQPGYEYRRAQPPYDVVLLLSDGTPDTRGCQLVTCGDAVLEGPEECDLGGSGGPVTVVGYQGESPVTDPFTMWTDHGNNGPPNAVVSSGCDQRCRRDTTLAAEARNFTSPSTLTGVSRFHREYAGVSLASSVAGGDAIQAALNARINRASSPDLKTWYLAFTVGLIDRLVPYVVKLDGKYYVSVNQGIYSTGSSVSLNGAVGELIVAPAIKLRLGDPPAVYEFTSSITDVPDLWLLQNVKTPNGQTVYTTDLDDGRLLSVETAGASGGTRRSDYVYTSYSEISPPGGPSVQVLAAINQKIAGAPTISAAVTFTSEGDTNTLTWTVPCDEVEPYRSRDCRTTISAVGLVPFGWPKLGPPETAEGDYSEAAGFFTSESTQVELGASGATTRWYQHRRAVRGAESEPNTSRLLFPPGCGTLCSAKPVLKKKTYKDDADPYPEWITSVTEGIPPPGGSFGIDVAFTTYNGSGTVVVSPVGHYARYNDPAPMIAWSHAVQISGTPASGLQERRPFAVQRFLGDPENPNFEVLEVSNYDPSSGDLQIGARYLNGLVDGLLIGTNETMTTSVEVKPSGAASFAPAWACASFVNIALAQAETCTNESGTGGRRSHSTVGGIPINDTGYEPFVRGVVGPKTERVYEPVAGATDLIRLKRVKIAGTTVREWDYYSTGSKRGLASSVIDDEEYTIFFDYQTAYPMETISMQMTHPTYSGNVASLSRTELDSASGLFGNETVTLPGGYEIKRENSGHAITSHVESTDHAWHGSTTLYGANATWADPTADPNSMTVSDTYFGIADHAVQQTNDTLDGQLLCSAEGESFNYSSDEGAMISSSYNDARDTPELNQYSRATTGPLSPASVCAAAAAAGYSGDVPGHHGGDYDCP